MFQAEFQKSFLFFKIISELENIKQEGKWEYEGYYGSGIDGCITAHNRILEYNIYNAYECRVLCDNYQWCVSVEYSYSRDLCQLSEYTKDSVSSDYWQSPCPSDFLYYQWYDSRSDGSEFKKAKSVKKPSET